VLQAVLLAMTVRFIFSGCARMPAALALFGAAVFGFAGNLAVVWIGGSLDPVPHTWISSLWMVSWECLVLAAAHPSMRQVAMPASQTAEPVPLARMVLLSASLLVAPGSVFLASIDDVRDAGTAAASAVLALLIVWRLFRLVGQREADRARQVAVVNLGHRALTGVELPRLFEDAAELVRATLPRATVTIVESDDAPRLLVTAQIPPEPDEHVFLESVEQVLVAAVARRKAEDAVRYLASHDPLTGLANRSLIADRLDHALRRAARTGVPMAVAFVDLDGFKIANDLYGHNAGDAVLVAVARRLESTLRDADTVGRLAGDEFALICESVKSVDDAVVLAERILAAVCRPVEVDGGTATVAASIGIALTSGEMDGEAALRAADAAMYRAKRQGTNGYLIDRDGVRLSR
jgi:diguanylate cyclase (GGDEF)-like protein